MDGIFDPQLSTNSIWWDEQFEQCLTPVLEEMLTDIDGKAAADHVHSYNDLSDLPTIPTELPANGGDADTVDGKHAAEFALATDVEILHNLVGDTSVSAQISTALTSIDHPVDSVNGKTGAVVLTAADVGALPADTVIPSVDGLATEAYVNAQVASVVDSSPDTLNTLNELAAALGDDPNFATTVATQIGAKVDKVDGKELSSNDYTDAEKTKLAGIAEGANKTVVDAALSTTSTNPVQNNVVSAAITSLNSLVGDATVSSQIETAIATKADADHTHNYAGSSSAGGAATSADKLNTNAGSATQPVYFANGVPVKTTYTLGTSVPSGAKFTDTTYSAATTSAAGLMSAADKTKLDGISTGANAYTLPTASSSTLGGVKTTSTVTSNSGYTACPIISGVPYYKDTNTTYSLSSLGLTATAAELNYVDGVTSNIQTQLDKKFAAAGGTITGNVVVNSGGASAITLMGPDNSDGEQAYARIYKNTSATADYGVQIRDYAHGGATTNTASILMLCNNRSDIEGKLQFVEYVNGSGTYYKLYGEHNKPTPSDIGAAASSHGTHVTFTTTVPKVAGTAAVGSATTVSRSDHVHPAQTSVSGNAGSATKLATARTIRTNLGSTSTASFDGSANVTPGVTGTLPIANGGTGATTAAAAVTKLGISDYIVAQGTSGIWTYRKWNSGVSECWGNVVIDYQIDCTTQRANAVYTDDTFISANALLPSGLFTEIECANANAQTNGYTVAQVCSVIPTTLVYRMWCPYPTLLNENTIISFQVKGRWK